MMDYTSMSVAQLQSWLAALETARMEAGGARILQYADRQITFATFEQWKKEVDYVKNLIAKLQKPAGSQVNYRRVAQHSRGY